MDRSIETWIDGKPAATMPVTCGVPQGSPCSPVLFTLTLAGALAHLPEGVSYVDDCSWVFSFNAQRDFQSQAIALLDKVKTTLSDHGFQIDQNKTEVEWIFASEKPGKKQREKVGSWKLKWQGLTRKFDIKAKPTRWLGFFVDCRLGWKAHIRHRPALGHHRLRTTSRIMTANGIPRRLAR